MRRTAVLIFVIGLFCAVAAWVRANPTRHNFEGRCQLCHVSVPEKGAAIETIVLRDNLDEVCAGCHKLSMRTSHPVGMRPSEPIPLERYLNREGRMTCVTCHEVHKEENGGFGQTASKGLLRGHAQGRAFCLVCHHEEALGSKWRHQTSIRYVHSQDRLSQRENGALLDEFSSECLSCHDGVISKMNTVVVRTGDFQHGIGLTHPVGVEYPPPGRADEFRSSDRFPEEVRLFDGKVGCLSCHNPYGGRKALLSMENKRSALCLTCHIK